LKIQLPFCHFDLDLDFGRVATPAEDFLQGRSNGRGSHLNRVRSQLASRRPAKQESRRLSGQGPQSNRINR
jgi:hypothetical protein